MAAATASGAAVSQASHAASESAATGGKNVAIPRMSGEPYDLAGKRIVFTNWFYVRPGSFGWYNDKGEGVTVVGSEGPWGAHMVKTDCPRGIRLVAQSAQRTGPIVKADRPYESDTPGLALLTIMRDGDIYKAWGSGSAYYESKDGRNWDRPELGLVEINGSKKNNRLSFPVGDGTIFKDPSAADSERYKWVTCENISQEQFETFKKKRPDAWNPRAIRKDVGHIYALVGAVSPDGINWTKLLEPFTVEHSDTQVTGYYDERLRKYVIYTRNYMIHETSGRSPDHFRSWWEAGRRSIGRTESDNFREFPLSEVIMEPSPSMEPFDLIYTNCKTTIPGAPDHHLMFPTIWHAAVDDTTSVALASSHDGRVWDWVSPPCGGVLETAEFGEWDGGCVFARPNLIELPNGDFALPYTGYDFPHKYPRGQLKVGTGYALWPKGRLVALEAKELGEFATVAIMPPGRKLRINAVTTRGGSIKVEVVTLDRAPIAGRSLADSIPIIGDQYRALATWKSGDDLGHQDGGAVVLRFKMDRASIFGLDFE